MTQLYLKILSGITSTNTVAHNRLVVSAATIGRIEQLTSAPRALVSLDTVAEVGVNRSSAS